MGKTAEWLESRLDDLKKLLADFETLINANHDDAFGPPGEPGDVAAIGSFCRRIASVYRKGIEWVHSVRDADVDRSWREVAHEVSFLGECLLGPIEACGPRCTKQLDAAMLMPPQETTVIDLPIEIKLDEERMTRVRAAISRGGLATEVPDSQAGNEPRTALGPQDPGFLYVLVNSAMPGLIKVGKTKRDPDARAQELSGVTGIPTPFVVAYHEWFSDCSAAEDYVHTFLEANGYRMADNREFFSAPVKVAIQAIMQAKAQQHQNNDEASGTPDADMSNIAGNDDVSPEPWSDLLAQAEAANYGLGDAIEDQKQAARLYEQAARLGSGEACLALGQLYRSEEFGSDDGVATKWFNEGVRKGAVECYAELALLYLEHNHAANAAKCFAKYCGLLDGQPVTDWFLRYCYSYLLTAAQQKIAIDNIEEFRQYGDQIVHCQEEFIARWEAAGKDVAYPKANLMRVQYMLNPGVPIRRIRGRVKWWDEGQGFGFVTGEDGRDAFFHSSEIEEGKLPPTKGQRVEFLLRMGPKGPIAYFVALT